MSIIPCYLPWKKAHATTECGGMWKTPVMWTPGLRHSAARKKCKKTQSKINVRLLAGTGGFWTGQAIPVSDFLCSGSRLSLGIGVEEPPAGARGTLRGSVTQLEAATELCHWWRWSNGHRESAWPSTRRTSKYLVQLPAHEPPGTPEVQG